jgi:hypothetical protein
MIPTPIPNDFPTLISGADDGAAVTTSDTTLIPRPKALYVGGAGDVAVQFVAGTTVTLKAVPVGILPIRPVRVMATNTTATNIVGLY